MSEFHRRGALALVACLALAGWGVTAAQSAPEPRANVGAVEELDAREVADRVEDQGYRRVVIASNRAPYVSAFGCADNDDYRLTLDDAGNVVDRERVGRCGGRESVSVRAPFTDVDVDGRDVSVRAPFADVDVDEHGVRVRAPFVDLNIPR